MNEVKQLRLQLGMSAKQFSDFLDVNYHTLKYHEGKRTTPVKFLNKIRHIMASKNIKGINNFIMTQCHEIVYDGSTVLNMNDTVLTREQYYKKIVRDLIINKSDAQDVFKNLQNDLIEGYAITNGNFKKSVSFNFPQGGTDFD